MNGYDQDEICLQWTGSWPNGRVRAEAPQWYAGVRLLVCGCRPLTDKWVIKGTQLTEKPPVWDYKTAAYAVGKIAYYKVCARYPVGRQGWQCWSNGDAHYLGD